MKTIITLIFIGLFQGLIPAQTADAAAAAKSSAMVYSSSMEALIYKDDGAQFGKEIVIESLPDFAVISVPVHVSQITKGTYTFKKDPKLVIPEFFNVVIEDNLTGGSFDLKNSDSYTFSVNRAIPDRFVLQISKAKATITAMR